MSCQAVTNGYKCGKGEITFSSPVDATNPLISHVWTIDQIEESTNAQFSKTFAAPGIHNVVHSGSNACGATCSNTVQLEIADVSPPPSQGAEKPKGINPLVVVGVVALGFLGIVMLKKE